MIGGIVESVGIAALIVGFSPLIGQVLVVVVVVGLVAQQRTKDRHSGDCAYNSTRAALIVTAILPGRIDD